MPNRPGLIHEGEHIGSIDRPHIGDELGVASRRLNATAI